MSSPADTRAHVGCVRPVHESRRSETAPCPLIRIVVALAILLTLAAAGRAAPADVLVVAADDATLRPLLQRMTDVQIETRAAWTFWRGRLDQKSLVLARSEGDPLNAVAATTLAIRLHSPKLVVAIGTSRAHDPTLRAGDIVVSQRFAAFDGMISPVLPLGGGSNSLQWNKRPHPLVTAGERETPREFFPADPTALALALSLRSERGRVVAGVLGSAHQVNREADRIAKLRDKWQTSTEDGESAHVAGVALLFNLPVIGIRIVDGTPAEAAAIAVKFLEVWK
jgi:adenosylhomocysteine nucleosidase